MYERWQCCREMAYQHNAELTEISQNIFCCTWDKNVKYSWFCAEFWELFSAMGFFLLGGGGFTIPLTPYFFLCPSISIIITFCWHQWMKWNILLICCRSHQSLKKRTVHFLHSLMIMLKVWSPVKLDPSQRFQNQRRLSSIYARIIMVLFCLIQWNVSPDIYFLENVHLIL